MEGVLAEIHPNCSLASCTLANPGFIRERRLAKRSSIRSEFTELNFSVPVGGRRQKNIQNLGNRDPQGVSVADHVNHAVLEQKL